MASAGSNADVVFGSDQNDVAAQSQVETDGTSNGFAGFQIVPSANASTMGQDGTFVDTPKGAVISWPILLVIATGGLLLWTRRSRDI